MRNLVRILFTRSYSYLPSGQRMNPTMVESSNYQGLPLQIIVDRLNGFAPTNVLSESWDNTGILIEPYTSRNVKRIILTNDLTEDVMAEAASRNVDMIVAYHPPIFAPFKSLTQRSWKERVVTQCLERGIAVFSPHTSWDAVAGGVNDWLAGGLPAHRRAPIRPVELREQPESILPGAGEAGLGRLCRLELESTVERLVEAVKAHCGLRHLRLALARGATLHSAVGVVALCAGSGASLLRGVPAHLYITGEMLHHDILEAVHNNTSVILTNHSDSERGFLAEFKPLLSQVLQQKVEVLLSDKDRDPIVTL